MLDILDDDLLDMLDKLLITEALIDDDFELIEFIELELIETVTAEDTLETELTAEVRLWFELLVFPVADELEPPALSPEAPQPAKYNERIMNSN